MPPKAQPKIRLNYAVVEKLLKDHSKQQTHLLSKIECKVTSYHQAFNEGLPASSARTLADNIADFFPDVQLTYRTLFDVKSLGDVQGDIDTYLDSLAGIKRTLTSEVQTPSKHELDVPTKPIPLFRRADSSVAPKFDAAGHNHYVMALKNFLDRLDDEVWILGTSYLPLEAEIEDLRSKRRPVQTKPDVIQFLLKSTSNGSYVILGEAGSGKSVALRQLTRLFADDHTRLPIYANLREFPANKSISKSSMFDFIFEQAASATGDLGRAYLNATFDEFRVTGRLVLILDSFDELPIVLDQSEMTQSHARVVSRLVELLESDFALCISIIATRPFRAPHALRGTRVILKSFSESTIHKLLARRVKQTGLDAAGYIKSLYRNCPSVAESLGNPLTAELVAQFISSSPDVRLPLSLHEVYARFIVNRLQSVLPTTKDGNEFDITQLRQAACELAWTIMSGKSGAGLELPLNNFELLSDQKNFELALNLLINSRLVRKCAGNSVAFTHRRYCEFFAADYLAKLADEEQLAILFSKLESIPNDTRWRECLLFFLHLANIKSKEYVACFCFRIVDDAFADDRFVSEAHVSAIHCLRFMVSAFDVGDQALTSIEGDLKTLLRKMLSSNDPLVARLAAQAIPLTNTRSHSGLLCHALRRTSHLVKESALRSCCRMNRISRPVGSVLRSHIRDHSLTYLYRNAATYSFWFSMSEAIKPQKIKLWADLCELPVTAFLLMIVLGIHLSNVNLFDTSILFVFFFLYIHLLIGAFCIANSPLHPARQIYHWVGRITFRSSSRSFFRIAKDALNKRIIARLSYRSDGWFALVRVCLIAAATACLVRISFFITQERRIFVPGQSWSALTENLQKGVLITIELLLCVLVVSLVIIGWEPAWSIRRYGQLRWHARSTIGKAIDLIGIGGPLVLIGWLVYGPRISLGISDTQFFPRIILVVLAVSFVVLSLVAILGIVIYLSWQAVSFIVNKVRIHRDRRRIRRMRPNYELTAGHVYTVCVTMSTKQGRFEYLRAIRKYRIKVRGVSCPIPAELANDTELADEIAQIRELWLELG